MQAMIGVRYIITFTNPNVDYSYFKVIIPDHASLAVCHN